jgi:hypothetical protein
VGRNIDIGGGELAQAVYDLIDLLNAVPLHRGQYLERERRLMFGIQKVCYTHAMIFCFFVWLWMSGIAEIGPFSFRRQS